MSASFTVTFNGTSLTSSVTGLSILDVSNTEPRRKLNSELVARESKRKTTGGFYVERYPTVRVAISRTTWTNVEASRAALLAMLQGVAKKLVVTQNTVVREYTASLSDIEALSSTPTHWHLNLVFQCDDNYAYDTSYTTIVNASAATGASRYDSYTFGGSADWQAPYFSVYYSSITDGTSKTVTVGNLATGQQIQVTRTWAASDTLVVDCENKTVKVNGIEVPFFGAWPVFQTGAATITYSDGFTDREFDYLVKYRKRWI